jgi:hypothetical protein
MSLKQQNYKFKLKRNPEQVSPSTPKFVSSGNMNLEILKLIRKLSSNQEDFQSYVISEIMTIHEKLDHIIDKFNKIEVEAVTVDEQELESQEEGSVAGMEFEESYTNVQTETYEVEESEPVADESQDAEQSQEVEEQETEQEQEQEQEGCAQVWLTFEIKNIIE